MISSFGDSSLPVFQAGQTSWQRPHSVHENRAGPEAHLLLGHVEAERLEPPARARAREVHVERRRGDVEVLRVRQVGEEAEDDQDVRPDEDALELRGQTPSRKGV
jgi:hypothetical protein